MHANDAVSPEYVRTRLHYSPETGNLVWKHCDSVPKNWNTKYAGKPAGFIDSAHGYVLVNILDKAYKAHRVIWAMVYGEWPEVDIDHEDGNPANNRLSNLRLAGPVMNHGNMKVDRANNTSGYKGVYWEPANKKWSARIKVNKKSRRLGMFISKHDAARAYNKAAIEGFGQFARVNVINDQE